jgi:hypothetical protein
MEEIMSLNYVIHTDVQSSTLYARAKRNKREIMACKNYALPLCIHVMWISHSLSDVM